MKTINRIFWPVMIVIMLIVAASIICSGQVQTIKPLPKDSVIVAMQIKGDNLRQIRETFLSSFTGTESDYDCWAASHKYSGCQQCKFIEVRLKYSGGQVHDLTFEQFKMIVYP